ncbi:MAG: acyl--CoA ligase, partial [Myxococcales bacterium]|nr:acyl--CoA ligase [Myxococcales bacterium]
MEDAFLFRHGLSPSSRRPDLPGAAQTVPVLLNAAVMERPSDEALAGRHARFSYEELSLASQRAAMMLSDLGISPGDRVAASLPNETEIVIAFLAAMRIGAIFVGIPLDWSLDDTLLAVEETDASLLLVDQATHDALSPRRAELRDLGHVLVAEPGRSEWNLSVDREEDLAPFDDFDPFAPALVSYERAPDGR